jgi:polysaccharide biosynthesis protein PslH
MKVVVVDWDIAYPANSGKRLRTLNLILQLAQRHEITYFSRGNGCSPGGRAAREFLNHMGIATVFANVPLPSKSTWGYKARLAGHLWSNDPLAVAVHRSAAFEEAINKYASQNEVDLWQLEWTPYVQMLPRSSNMRSLVIAHNVDSLIWQRYCETEKNFLRRQLFVKQWRKFQCFERKAFNQATGVVAVSSNDARMLWDKFNVRYVEVVENGVDIDYYSQIRLPRDPRKLLFLGSLDWRPNLDAVNALLDDILPRLERAEPMTSLEIVGRNPPAWLSKKIAAHANVALHANVTDVRPHLAQAGMMVVPLRIGGGSRLKILEAMASSLPVVSSTIGAEGLQVKPGYDLQIADGFDEVTQAIISWMRQPELAAAAAGHGLELVRNHYSWERLARQLESVWEKTVSLSALVEQTC